MWRHHAAEAGFTCQHASAVSLTNGTFLAPNVLPGTYAITATAYVMSGTSQVTVGSSSVSGLQLVAAPGAELTGSVVLNPGGAPAVGALVSVTAETLYNLEATQQLTKQVLGRLGCPTCCSGRQILFQQEEGEFSV